MAHEMFLAEDFYNKADSIYEAILAIARRARQIGEDQRKEMDAYLSQVEMLEKFQEEEDTYDEPLRPHEPVLQFEKATILSLREMIADKLEINNPVVEEIRRAEREADEEVEASVASAGTFPEKLDLSGDEGEAGSFPSKLSLTDEDDEEE